MDPTALKNLPLSPITITPITPTWMNATLKQEDDTSSCATSPSRNTNTTPPSLIRPFPKTNITLPTLPTTTLPLPATLPSVFPYPLPISIPVTPQATHLDELLAVDPEAEAARKPKKRRRTKRQRLLELQAQLEREADGSEQHQEQAEKLLEQLNRPSGRKRRRIASELVDAEKWFCPYECGKFYRKTSTRSIFEHQVECRKKMLEQRQKEKEVTIPAVVSVPTTPNLFTPTFNMTFTPNLMQHSPFASLLMSQFPFQSQQSASIINTPSSLFSPSQRTHSVTSSLPITSPNFFTRPLPHLSSFPISSPLHLMRPIALTSR